MKGLCPLSLLADLPFSFCFLPPNDNLFCFHLCPEFYVFFIYPENKSGVRYLLPIFSAIVTKGRCPLSSGKLCSFGLSV